MDPNAPIVVYATTDVAQAEIVKTSLQAENIRAMVTGETQGGFSGVIPEVTVVVPASDVEKAREIIESHEPKAT